MPIVAARADGVIGVMYYDFRDDTADASTLLTDLWLARSADAGATWTEARLAGPFDLTTAPLTEGGYFLGEYQALAATASRFVTLFATTNADLANRTDVYTAPAALLTREAEAHMLPRAVGVTEANITPALRQRASDALLQSLRSRWPGWRRPEDRAGPLQP
ncbi:MAG: hypothetical protein ACR2GP_04955 [Burkholderiaceae bacterium]